jgi:hypothetical protein
MNKKILTAAPHSSIHSWNTNSPSWTHNSDEEKKNSFINEHHERKFCSKIVLLMFGIMALSFRTHHQCRRYQASTTTETMILMMIRQWQFSFFLFLFSSHTFLRFTSTITIFFKVVRVCMLFFMEKYQAESLAIVYIARDGKMEWERKIQGEL